MRGWVLLLFGSMAVACASPTPSWSSTSPTHPDAPEAPPPSVATALTEDPAPPPEATDMEERGHVHHGHGAQTEPPPATGDDAPVEHAREREEHQHAH